MAHFLYLSLQHGLRIIMIWIVGFATLTSSMPEFSIPTTLMVPTLFSSLILRDLFFLILLFTLLKLRSISARQFKQILPVTCKSPKLFDYSVLFLDALKFKKIKIMKLINIKNYRQIKKSAKTSQNSVLLCY